MPAPAPPPPPSSFPSPYPGFPHRYYVYASGSTYNAKNMSTGNIDFSNSDAATVIQYALNNSGWQIGSVYIQSGTYNLSTSLQPNSYNVIVSQPTETGAILQVNGNFPAILLNANAHNFYLQGTSLFHQQSGYTSSLVQIREGVRDCVFRDVEFWDGGFNVGTCVEFSNNAAANTSDGMYNLTFENIISSGFQQNYKVTIPNTSNWINTMRILGGKYWNSKYLIYSNVTSSANWANVNGWILSDIMWQYDDSGTNSTPSGHGVIMFDDIAEHAPTMISNSYFWDLPTDRNTINTNASSEYFLSGVPYAQFGGSGASTAKVHGLS